MAFSCCCSLPLSNTPHITEYLLLISHIRPSALFQTVSLVQICYHLLPTMLRLILILPFLIFVFAFSIAEAASPQFPQLLREKCNCTGTNDTGAAGVDYVCRDPRLGPKILPRKFPLLSIVSDYDRFGGLTAGEFLAKWTNAQGYYVYPEKYGFLLNDNGDPILGNTTLPVGTKLDRFGSEWGTSIDMFFSFPFQLSLQVPAHFLTPTVLRR